MATERVSHLRWLRVAVPILVVAAILGLAIGAEATDTPASAFGFRADNYKYRQITSDISVPGFETLAFDDASWNTGSAGFGSQTQFPDGICSWNNPTDVQTPWSPDTDLLVRKHFTLPPGAHNLRVDGTVDNEATVYINGTQIGFTSTGFCIPDTIAFAASDQTLKVGDNVLAIRARDLGQPAYLDVQVTYDVGPVTFVIPTDQSLSHKRTNAALPLKLWLVDFSGNDISSSAIVVHATGLKQVDGTASATLDDAGNSSSPTNDFNFVPTIGPSGGYQYNLKTPGLIGTWQVTFTVNGRSDPSYVLYFDIK